MHFMLNLFALFTSDDSEPKLTPSVKMFIIAVISQWLTIRATVKALL